MQHPHVHASSFPGPSRPFARSVSLAGVAAAAILGIRTADAQSATVVDLGPGCGNPVPRLSIDPPVLGRSATIAVEQAFPNAMGYLGIAPAPPVRTVIHGCVVHVDLAAPLAILPFHTDAQGRWSVTVPMPPDPGLAGQGCVLQALLWSARGDWLTNGLLATYGMPDVCLLVIDEDTIDNDISTIEAAAQRHQIAADRLVNDDRPTETGNPWLSWNTLFPGDVVVLPGGQLGDEGLFALPANAPWPWRQFEQGTLPQSALDPVHGVTPLRNEELASLVGLDCVAVVYDSDISINYGPLQGNLQGARYGRFAFRVLEVLPPGSIPESRSSSSLFDLRVRVLPPIAATKPFEAAGAGR